MTEDIHTLMHRAQDSLSDAEFLFEADRLMGVPNRSYHAIFDAVNALLRIHETYTKTHRGAQQKLNELFIKPGLLSTNANFYLEQCFKLRQQADYEFAYETTQEDARLSIQYAREFLALTETYLKSQRLL